MTTEKEKNEKRRTPKEDDDCIYVVSQCDEEDAPAVTSDCGHTDKVVRSWAQSKYRNLADPEEPPEPKAVAICDDEDVEEVKREEEEAESP